MTEELDATKKVSKISEKINSHFSAELWLDFEMTTIQNSVLTMKASTDFTYYHECEIVCSGIQYFSGPMAWGSNPPDGLIETLPKSHLLNLIDWYGVSPDCYAIAIKTDTIRETVVVAASCIEVDFDIVYYYERENLGANERLEKHLDDDRHEGNP